MNSYMHMCKVIKIKEVRIASKCKEISSYPIRNSYILAITHQSALPTVSLAKCMWLKVMDINSVVYLKDLITTLAVLKCIYK